MTKQREAILDVIRSDMCHHTAEEIFALARERLPSISRATVYNNLKALEERKLIRRITGDGLSDRYDSSYIPHGHLLCEKCGRVWDFTISEFDDIIEKAIKKEFSSYELKVRHVCPDCMSN
jgi:Fur family peroxide stress response transcriptional regulator